MEIDIYYPTASAYYVQKRDVIALGKLNRSRDYF